MTEELWDALLMSSLMRRNVEINHKLVRVTMKRTSCLYTLHIFMLICLYFVYLSTFVVNKRQNIPYFDLPLT